MQTVSTRGDDDDIENPYPKFFMFITIYSLSMLANLLAILMLFFVAGFASHFSMVIRGRSHIQSLLERIKTMRMVAYYQGTVYVTTKVYPLPPADKSVHSSYYTSREGIRALLNGPMVYLLAVLLLDNFYAPFRSISLYFGGNNRPPRFITTRLRYNIAREILLISGILWIYMRGLGYPNSLIAQATVQNCFLRVPSATELHFPVLFIIAYIAGIHFIQNAKYILTPTKGSRVSATLFVALVSSFAIFYFIVSAFPEISRLLGVRHVPSLVSRNAAAACSLWALLVLATVPEALICVFFCHPKLGADWKRSSRWHNALVLLDLYSY
ncbi:hypothetical protein BDN70DRAFT_937133 [Pholiota conissans]|uniref:Uncharacterized protein n=1 Tax=Pholiota conissans TaxID=109636 RepID=A0A9P6CV48_9AGAR|nr:hypothetical protein BDN70DRAFT_937133 [Pholiota conissans]